MLCGRPVVATDVGAVSEWIEDGQTGFIAEASTAKSFGAALNRAWQSQSQWKQMGIQAHKDATEKLDYSPGQSLLKLVLDASKK
jgi:glycosyltransferase involved in cell wall biosynthesis